MSSVACAHRAAARPRAPTDEEAPALPHRHAHHHRGARAAAAFVAVALSWGADPASAAPTKPATSADGATTGRSSSHGAAASPAAGPPTGGPGAASGGTLAADQATADAIAARIAEEGHRLDVLSEQVDAATIAEQQVRAALVAAEARAAATDAATRAAEALLADEALAAYTDAGNESLSPTAESLTHVAPDLIAAYGAIVAGSQQATITALHQLRRRQADDEAGLRDAEAQATATAAALTADRDAASSAQAEQRATLGQVQGGMATLVAAAEARRAAAAATIEQQSLASSGVSLADARPSAVAPATAATVPTARQAVAAPGGAGPTTSGRPPAAGPAATAAPARPTTSAATSTSTSATSRPASTTSDAPAGTATTGGPTPGGQASGGQVGPQAPGAPDALRYARAQIGKPYQWGAAGPDSFDCSGLVMMAWRSGGVDFPHLAQDQYDMTEREPLSAALPGDLIFFGTPGNVYHVGIYVGGGQMIDAPQTGEDVQQQSIYWTDLLGAGRVTG